jgi:hypothetical protein
MRVCAAAVVQRFLVGDVAPETSGDIHHLVIVFRNPVLGLRNQSSKFDHFLAARTPKFCSTGISRGYGFVRSVVVFRM